MLTDLGFGPGWASLLGGDVVAGWHARLRAGELSDPSGLRRSALREQIAAGQLGAEALLALVAAEPEAGVRQDALKRLARAPWLDRWRLELLKMHALYADPALQAVVERESMRRGVQEPEPERALLEAALDSGDEELHAALLGLVGLPGEIRAGLAERGATRAIRRAARGEQG